LQQGKFSLLGYRMFENSPYQKENGLSGEYLPFWEYRRLIAASNFPAHAFPRDLAMINWESNDMRSANIIDQPLSVAAQRLAKAKYLSLGFLYWMQTEMPRDDGAKGYPELKLRSDILGTNDGLSKYPYIRESRRLKARYTIVEEDIACSSNPGVRAKNFSDSLGIGLYPIDIHGPQDVPGAGQATRPFQIPASAMVSLGLRNYLPAAKNLGTSHVSNGAYRLHPIEWSLGEAAALFAYEALNAKTDTWRLLKNKRSLRRLQKHLLSRGVPLVWFDDLSPEDPSFAAAQYLALTQLMPMDTSSLQFRPKSPLTRAELSISLQRLLRLSPVADSSWQISDLAADDSRYESIVKTCAHGLMKLTEAGEFRPDSPVTLSEMQELSSNPLLRFDYKSLACDYVQRADFADWLYALAIQPRFFGRH
ncbi:MAG: FAD-dependent oxidoreductase, partial [Candidatus Obscuribacterales bacterium]|nr:FAD-dependent oxidoreductase [Candidatus Obscuribacterales bacterium]